MSWDQALYEQIERIHRGGAPKYHEANRAVGKLFVRERLRLLLDPDSFVEDGLLANNRAPDLPADGVVTGVGRIAGRPVAIMANDSTVKAGSWGSRVVEKIVRIQEVAMRHRSPLIYLVDSAGARIPDQIELFPGRRHAGRIFNNQSKMSGVIPQICLLLGPSAAGGAYIPAFCDVVIMREPEASMYLGSPRMAAMVTGEKFEGSEREALVAMGGARMHCTVSGCGDFLVQTEEEGIELVKQYLSHLPQNCAEKPAAIAPQAPETTVDLAQIVPENPARAYDMMKLIRGIIDAGSWFELKKLYAGEILTGFARIEGQVIGVIANQPRIKGGTLFVDSADKAARFLWLCDAYNIPLLFLCDVPGFMIGSQVERQGIIRAGAKMIMAVADATVPKISVIVRKAYGAGLYAMCGPGFEPDACLALPTASIAVMGPEPAVNAVYYNQIQRLPEEERGAFIAEKRQEYSEDIDLYRLANDLVIDAVVPGDQLRRELSRRYALYASKELPKPVKRHAVIPM